MSHSTHYTLDTLLEMYDDGLLAASAIWEVDGVDKIIDVGAAEWVGEVLVDVSALEIASNDEAYTMVIQGSSDADFGTAGNIVELAHLHLGASETKLSDCDRDDTTGRYVIPVQNTYAGTTYRYLRGYTAVAGTIATGINFSAWMCKRK